MGVLEIVLLVLGAGIFVLSFLLPAGTAETGELSREAVREEAKNAVEKEMEGVKGRIEDIVDETVTYAVEKTERSLERISNEKIMAVNEYSDTVLEDINKNHKEVMFLYDMLNDKHENLKNTVSQVEKTVKEAEQNAREAAMAKAQEPPREEKKKPEKKAVKRREKEPEEGEFQTLSPQKVSENADSVKIIRSVPKDMDISFTQEGQQEQEGGSNNNERILQLHNEGRSNVAIARELGLGVGEVKLVIDLFEGV